MSRYVIRLLIAITLMALAVGHVGRGLGEQAAEGAMSLPWESAARTPAGGSSAMHLADSLIPAGLTAGVPQSAEVVRIPGSGFLVGVNYVGHADRAWQMWEDGKFDASVIEKDLTQARAAGAQTVRLFVSTALQKDLSAGRWDKLDNVLGIARRVGVKIILTLYDYTEDDLTKVAALDQAIAQRYVAEPAILAYDLKNEPHYQNLAVARYPGQPAPLQGDSLIRQYGERMNRAAADAWRQGDGKNLVPSRFSADEAYVYANNYTIYREFLGQAASWVAARNYTVSTLDYVDSGDSAKWRGLLGVLDDTLSAWMGGRIAAIRGADPSRPLTLGYSDALLAKLSSNKGLNIVSLHRYPSQSLDSIQGTFQLLRNLKATFPNRPILFEEFGFSNATVEPLASALYETAVLLQLLNDGMAGGMKWMLYDVAGGFDPRENAFGMFRTDGVGKPISTAMRALSAYLTQNPRSAGQLNMAADGANLRYTYRAQDAIVVGGQSVSDDSFAVDGEMPLLTFATWTGKSTIRLSTISRVTMRLNLPKLVGRPAGSGPLALRNDDTNEVRQITPEGDWLRLDLSPGSYSVSLPRTSVDAKIEIVWPQDSKPVTEASRANLAAFVFESGSMVSLPSTFESPVRLWRALNTGVEQQVAVGQRISRPAGDLRFPSWEFNDVDVQAAQDPQNKYYFRVSVDGLATAGNIWSHGADARTYFPEQDRPDGVATAAPQAVDAKIEIVWPKDNLPVEQATQANIAALLFVRGSTTAVPANFDRPVKLWRALNNEPAQLIATGTRVLKNSGGITFPAWEFNDVDVSAARDPVNKYYFRVTVDGVDSASNIWSHGSDARTYFPQPDVPESVSP